MNFGDIKKVHFVGIGGIGMSGIAEILSEAGVSVSGCDLKPSAAGDLLRSRGISVSAGHDPSHLDGVDLVVMTAAVKGVNREIDEAHKRGIRVMRRSEMLGELVNARRSIGVSGTHGKTTTSSMIAVILGEAGLDPTVLIGGMLRNIGGNAKTGRGEFLVVEADEYDRTFHHLHPEVAVVTNIEADHLEYYGSFENILEAFRVFLDGIRPGGSVIACVDDPSVAELVKQIKTRVIGYGLSPEAELRATNLQFDERGSTFDVSGVGSFRLFVPGEHNVRNALGAIGAARELGLDASVIARGLTRFLGVDRRFQILGEYSGAIVVDDYAHHPTEIRATLAAARARYPGRRVWAVWQPHTYSRTRTLFDDFAASFRDADLVLVTEVYAAREPKEDFSASRVVEAMRHPGARFTASLADTAGYLLNHLRPGDVVLVLSAGDADQVSAQVLDTLRERIGNHA